MKAFFYSSIALVALLTIRPFHARSQSAAPSLDQISRYFSELEQASKRHSDLWGVELYGPLLLIDPATRQIYANAPDSAGALRAEGPVYRGVFPDHLNMANTALSWSGVRWAMVMLPLGDRQEDRVRLLAHESFHRVQPELGFTFGIADNAHLDDRAGRSLLRLELEALKRAVSTDNVAERRRHLANAFVFRWHRHGMYPSAAQTENALELNEGLAEYTGLTVAGPGKEGLAAHVEQTVTRFLANPSFVRSFAYHTTPIYGCLLAEEQAGWVRSIDADTDLTEFFRAAFGIDRSAEVQTEMEAVQDEYGWDAIDAEEHDREEAFRRRVAEYTDLFVHQPHFELWFENMNVSFDPRNVLAMGDLGTVYPSIRVSDNWGVLTVTEGGLMSSDWKKLTVSKPDKTEGRTAVGRGWTLELAEGYRVAPTEDGKNFVLVKD